MCMICIDLDKDKLTFKEAWKNYLEMQSCIDAEHKLDLKQKMIYKLVEERRRQKSDDS